MCGWGGIAVQAWLWPLAGDNVLWGPARGAVLGVQGVTQPPSHLAPPHPMAFITSYPAYFGGHGALLVGPLEQLSAHQMLATSREARSVAMQGGSRKEMGS